MKRFVKMLKVKLSLVICLVCVCQCLGQGQLSTADYGESDYEDKDVRFDPSAPNLLILLADNGTTVPLSNKPNTDVVLDRNFKKVHLFCSAYYPIKWIYHGDGFPFMNVDNTRFTEDFYDPTSYAFSALLELEGLKESQTGNYTCHKWDDPSFSSSYYVYVPGDRILLPEKNSTIYVDSTYTEIDIPCSVSDPTVNVTLSKRFNKGQGESEWVPLLSQNFNVTFNPKSGFHLDQRIPSGTSAEFLCSVQDFTRQANVTVTVISQNNRADSGKPKEDCCDKKYLRSLGNERTSCRGFISKNCQTSEYLDADRSVCTDWKLAEFLKNPVELCKQEIAPLNSSVGIGYFTSSDNGPARLFMYCQADPAEFTQGFKMAVEWSNGSMLFVDDERALVPGLSEFPSGYEVHAEITDLFNPERPIDELTLHCYIPLKYSFKWIKLLKKVPSEDLKQFAAPWYGYTESSTSTTRGFNPSTSPPPYVRPIGKFNQIDTNSIDEKLTSDAPYSTSLSSCVFVGIFLRMLIGRFFVGA